MASELKPCPLCGALPCDWVDDPHKAEVGLCWTLAKIREVLGVGEKPMLDELPGIIAERLTRPAPEYAGLVERLREQGNRAANWYRPDDAATCDEAATALTALTERNKALEAEVAALQDALVQHNDRVRSAVAIAHREGAETNWKAFRGECHYTLAEYHELTNEARAALGDRP